MLATKVSPREESAIASVENGNEHIHTTHVHAHIRTRIHMYMKDNARAFLRSIACTIDAESSG